MGYVMAYLSLFLAFLSAPRLPHIFSEGSSHTLP